MISKFNILYEQIMNSLVLEELNNDVNIGNSAIGYLLSCIKKEQIIKIDYSTLKERALKTWKYYDTIFSEDVENDINLIMFSYDFGSVDSFKNTIYNFTGLNNDNEEEIYDKYFKTYLKKTVQGECDYTLCENQDIIDFFGEEFNDAIIIFINTRYSDLKGTILHEFVHIIDAILAVINPDSNNFYNNDRLKILKKKLENTYGNLIINKSTKQLLSGDEMHVRYSVDLFNSLQKLYWKKYSKDMSWTSFIDTKIEVLKNPVEAYSYIEKDIYKELKYIENDRQAAALIELLAQIGHVDEEFFEEIIKGLKNEK